MNTQLNVSASVHPDIKQALESVKLAEVQELIRKISSYGLAVALPHSHAPNGSFLPLPEDKVQFESKLKISFVDLNAKELENSIPVMWRWNDEVESVASCALCDFYAHP